MNTDEHRSEFFNAEAAKDATKRKTKFKSKVNPARHHPLPPPPVYTVYSVYKYGFTERF